MSVFEHEQPQRRDDIEEAAAPAAPQGMDVDDILADIDAVLDVNAEEFVRSFVQKGGQ